MEGFRPQNLLALEENSVRVVRLDRFRADLMPPSSFVRARPSSFVCAGSSSFVRITNTPARSASEEIGRGRTSLLALRAGLGKGTPHAETRRARSSLQSARSPLLPSAVSASPRDSLFDSSGWRLGRAALSLVESPSRDLGGSSRSYGPFLPASRWAACRCRF